jgi:hypothetical protein
MSDDIKLTFNDKGHPIAWLTWAQRENGLMELRCISLTKKHSKYAVEAVTYEKNHPSAYTPIIRIWTEEVELEHIYGGSITQEWLANAKITQPRKKRDGD